MKCPSCGFENLSGVDFCGNCGTPMHEKKRQDTGRKLLCPHCGQENPPGSRFCQNCGSKILKAAVPAQPAAAPPPRTAPTPAPVTAPAHLKKRMPGRIRAVIAGFGIIVTAVVLIVVFWKPAAPNIPQESPASSGPASSPIPCEDKLAFISDLTVPDGTSFEPGETFTKSWRIKNAGTCDWTTGYQLAYREGQRMGASPTLDLPRVVSSGEEIDLSIDLTAPSDPGNHKGFWNLKDEDGNIVQVEGVVNNAIFVDIRVREVSLPVMEPFKEGDEAEKIGDLVKNEDSPNNTWTADIPADKAVKFSWGWCAMTREILDENLGHMQILFYVDDKDVTNSMSQAYSTNQGWSCLTYAGLIRSWPSGQHIVRYKMIFEKKVNDGEKDYEGETNKTYIINIESSSACTPGNSLYAEDFEDGQAQGWPTISASLAGPDPPGWKIVDESGNKVLQHADASSFGGDELQDYTFDDFVWQARFKFIGSDADMFFMWRITYAGLVRSRYVVVLGAPRMPFMVRFTDSPTEVLPRNVASASSKLNQNQWYDITITYFDGTHQVWYDDQLQMSYSDSDPFPAGTIGFETHLEQGKTTQFYVDDMVICGLDGPYQP